MKKKLTVFASEANRESTRILKGIFTGAIVGGILGTLAGFLNAEPGPVLAVSPVAAALTRTVFGIFIVNVNENSPLMTEKIPHPEYTFS